MAAARYWRISGMRSASNSLALSALALSDGTTNYPTSTLSAALSAGFRIDWDLGSAIVITQIKLTSTTQIAWPSDFLLESSADGLSYAGAPGAVGTLLWPGGNIAATVTPGGSGTTAAAVSAIAQPSGTTNIADNFMPEACASQTNSGLARVDLLDGGSCRIAGVVAEKALPTNHPLARHVVLMDERSRRVVRETWSDDAGNYAFDSITPVNTYTVLAYDHTGTYRAVIADNLMPTLP